MTNVSIYCITICIYTPWQKLGKSYKNTISINWSITRFSMLILVDRNMMGHVSIRDSASVPWTYNALKYLLEKVLQPSQLQILYNGVDKFISECRHQPDRSYPQATFTMGISHTTKMKGTKKFAAIFYIALYLHTKDVERILDSTNKRKWIKLFQNFLFNCERLMQHTYTRSDLLSKQTKIKNLLK